MKSKYFSSISFIFKGFLGYLAYISAFPSFLSPLLNKVRGVKIKDVFNVYIAPNVLIDSIYPEAITIEEDVYLTRGVKVLSHFNPTASLKEIIGNDSIVKATIVKKGAFVGVNSIINAGITVGESSIIAAGSVVVKDVPEFAIVGGNPAKVIGDVRTHNWSKND